MEKKQTAVQQLEEYLTISLGKDRMRMLLNEFQKAKEMEKEQIVNAHGIKENHGWKNGQSWWEMKTGEEYYNETYKSE